MAMQRHLLGRHGSRLRHGNVRHPTATHDTATASVLPCLEAAVGHQGHITTAQRSRRHQAGSGDPATGQPRGPQPGQADRDGDPRTLPRPASALTRHPPERAERGEPRLAPATGLLHWALVPQLGERRHRPAPWAAGEERRSGLLQVDGNDNGGTGRGWMLMARLVPANVLFTWAPSPTPQPASEIGPAPPAHAPASSSRNSGRRGR